MTLPRPVSHGLTIMPTLPIAPEQPVGECACGGECYLQGDSGRVECEACRRTWFIEFVVRVRQAVS